MLGVGGGGSQHRRAPRELADGHPRCAEVALRLPSWPGSAVRRFSVFIQRFSQTISHISTTKFALCALARVAPKYISHVGTDSYRQSRCCSKTDCTCDDPVYLNCFISVPTRIFPARGQTRASSGLHLPEPRLAGEGPTAACQAGRWVSVLSASSKLMKNSQLALVANNAPFP